MHAKDVSTEKGVNWKKKQRGEWKLKSGRNLALPSCHLLVLVQTCNEGRDKKEGAGNGKEACIEVLEHQRNEVASPATLALAVSHVASFCSVEAVLRRHHRGYASVPGLPTFSFSPFSWHSGRSRSLWRVKPFK